MAFRVRPTRNAETEIMEAYEWMLENYPDRAADWYNDLFETLASLQDFPNRCPLALENSLFTQEVRQLLQGKGKSVFRILFTIQPEEEMVYILHIRHSARRPLRRQEIREDTSFHQSGDQDTTQN